MKYTSPGRSGKVSRLCLSNRHLGLVNGVVECVPILDRALHPTDNVLDIAALCHAPSRESVPGELIGRGRLKGASLSDQSVCKLAVGSADLSIRPGRSTAGEPQAR